MSLATTIQKVEETVEKDILAFFRMLGASEAPEEWECAPPKAATPGQSGQGMTMPDQH